MAKKTIIQFEYDWDFTLIGLVTILRDYQLCWHLNKLFELNLKKTDDLELNLRKKNKLLEFTHFRFDDDLNKLEYHIIGNKCMGNYLIPEYKILDYLLVIKGYFTLDKKAMFVSKLKSLTSLTTLLEVNAEELVSRENLILE